MQFANLNIADLRWAMGAVRGNEEILTQYVLAGLLNVHLRSVPMSIVHREQRELKYTYPILRFDVYPDVRKPSMGREYTHWMVAPVIDQPSVKQERIVIHNRESDTLSVVLNIGYTEPPKVEEPPVEERQDSRRDTYGERSHFFKSNNIDMSWGTTWTEVARMQVELMRLWAEAFPGQSYRTARFQEGAVVIASRDLRCEQWPQVPMYRVVAQVQPFINDGRGSGDTGLVDTIIQPLGHMFGGSPSYVHSGNLLTLNQYEARLVEPASSVFNGPRGDYEPSSFIVEEVIKKVPDSVRELFR
ncbi:hypothetical protein FDI21_gp254 [Pseudomonas phage Noxifer]|uniref:Uncharacterized protein n=1 Tax=Pseudomonas phage Noxifer TaxID=2006684 RepID=A0A1Y0T3H8_9CAUD|nr:hypothetical protein FDI21_gp254 [Pseudomonas phage Noxifer]ARV77457.1 hypothetical protein NOXIFER_292 [Pseudomonas phage Noxifer]